MKTIKYLSVLVSIISMFGISSVQAGDKAAGETLYSSRGCVGCHGPAGKSVAPTMFPVLAGKEEDYLVEQLKAFKEGTRQNPTMQPMASGLSDEDMENLAEYLSEQE